MIAAYLIFNGNTEAAFNFYKSVLGGEFTKFQRFSDTPHGDNMSEEDKVKIMHVTLETSHGIIRANDHIDFMGSFISGNNFSLSVHTSSEEEATRVFNGLSNGGNITMPLEKVFWGAYFGVFTDKFGVKWMVHHDY